MAGSKASSCPPGSGGAIIITFRPATPYHLALIISILLALTLLTLAAWSLLHRSPQPPPTPPSPPRAALSPPPGEPMVVAPYWLLRVERGIHWLPPRFAAAARRRLASPSRPAGLALGRLPRTTWLPLLAVTALLAVAGGWLALAVPLLAALAWLPRPPRPAPPGHPSPPADRCP